jgi:hypothetical protein
VQIVHFLRILQKTLYSQKRSSSCAKSNGNVKIHSLFRIFFQKIQKTENEDKKSILQGFLWKFYGRQKCSLQQVLSDSSKKSSSFIIILQKTEITALSPKNQVQRRVSSKLTKVHIVRFLRILERTLFSRKWSTRRVESNGDVKIQSLLRFFSRKYK